jgi:hypothetical protein
LSTSMLVMECSALLVRWQVLFLANLDLTYCKVIRDK